MDEYTDKSYQGTGFSGQQMGGTQTAAPNTPSTMEPPAADPAQPVLEGQSTWTEPEKVDSGDMAGLMVQGALLGFFFGIFGVAGVAFFSASEKRADRVMGSIIGILVSFFVAGVIIVVTA